MTQSVIQLQRGLPSGWSLSMFLVPLGDDRLLVYSPTWLGSKTFEMIEEYGRPTVLLAPNSYHHLSLPRYRERYPEARVLAATKARPRLAQKGHKGIEALEEATDVLPEGMRFLPSEGTKSGETFLSVPDDDGRAWIVCDGFFNVPGPLQGAKGTVVKLIKAAPGFSVGTTFWLLALKNKQAYLSWLKARLDEDQPRRMLFCHGVPLDGEDLPERIYELAKRRLG